jgi:hypothetical protein
MAVLLLLLLLLLLVLFDIFARSRSVGRMSSVPKPPLRP